MRAVGQLDQDHPYIARHRQQHFAKRLGLVFLARVELKLVQLGQPVHQLGHGRAKALHQLGFGDATVFNGIVQQRSHQRLCIKLPVRTLGGHSNRMRDVGLTAVANLAQVRFIRKSVSQPYLLEIGHA